MPRSQSPSLPPLEAFLRRWAFCGKPRPLDGFLAPQMAGGAIRCDKPTASVGSGGCCKYKMFVSEVINKPLSPGQARIKSLNDQAKRLRDQAKQARAQQKVRKAQADLARARQLAIPSVAAEGCATGKQFQTVPRGSKVRAVFFDTKSVVD